MPQASIDLPQCVSAEASYVGEPTSERSTSLAPPRGTAWFRTQVVIECLDTVSVLRTYRAPRAGETWTTPEPSERRLLAQIDALMALGARALSQVEALALDPDVPDANRLFGAALVLSCAEEARWEGAVLSLFETSATLSQPEQDAMTEALCLSPNRRLIEALAPFARSPSDALRAAAVRILSFHDVLTEEGWHLALRDSHESVVASALKASARGFELAACRRALGELFESGAAGLKTQALRMATALRLKGAYDFAAAEAESDADMLATLASFGRKEDVATLARHLTAAPARAALAASAAALLGYPDVIPHLFDVWHRDAGATEASPAASAALRMITGLKFSPDDFKAAVKVWNAARESFDTGYRFRFGKYLTPQVLLEHLSGPFGPRVERERVYTELQAFSTLEVPGLNVFQFVGAQRRSLSSIQEWLTANPNQHGVVGALL